MLRLYGSTMCQACHSNAIWPCLGAAWLMPLAGDCLGRQLSIFRCSPAGNDQVVKFGSVH